MYPESPCIGRNICRTDVEHPLDRCPLQCVAGRCGEAVESAGMSSASQHQVGQNVCKMQIQPKPSWGLRDQVMSSLMVGKACCTVYSYCLSPHVLLPASITFTDLPSRPLADILVLSPPPFSTFSSCTPPKKREGVKANIKSVGFKQAPI